MIDVTFVNEFVSWQFWAFVGIVLEIIGFFFITFLWGIHPKKKEHLDTWITKHQAFYDAWNKNMTLDRMDEIRKSKKWYQQVPWSTMYIDEVVENKMKPSGEEYNLFVRYLDVPNRFRWEWALKTKLLGMGFVIFGLVLQGAQLLRFELL